jgi:hypothetical protein
MRLQKSFSTASAKNGHSMVGDLEGRAIWRRILRAVEELLSTELSADHIVN